MSKVKSVLVAYYNVKNVGPVTAEVEVGGPPASQYLRIEEAICKKHKCKPTDLIRMGSTIELRDGTNQFVDLLPGITIGQVFEGQEGHGEGEGEGEGESKRIVGSVFLNGTPWDVELVNLRAAGSVRVQLNPKLKNETTMRFSNQLNPMTLAKELPRIIKEIVGADARDLKLRFREVKHDLSGSSGQTNPAPGRE